MAESPDLLSQNLARVVSSASPLGADQQAMRWGCWAHHQDEGGGPGEAGQSPRGSGEEGTWAERRKP